MNPKKKGLALTLSGIGVALVLCLGGAAPDVLVRDGIAVGVEPQMSVVMSAFSIQ